MKVYMIIHHVEGFSPYLYGYTDDKNIKELFMDQRDPEQFSVSTVDMGKKEFNKYRVEKPGNFISTREYKTSINDEISMVKLAVTSSEDMSIYSEYVIYKFLFKTTTPAADYLKSEYMKALFNLLYFHIRSMAENLEIVNPWEKDPFLAGVNCQTIPYSYEFDELSVFIKLHGNTLRDDLKIKRGDE